MPGVWMGLFKVLGVQTGTKKKQERASTLVSPCKVTASVESSEGRELSGEETLFLNRYVYKIWL